MNISKRTIVIRTIQHGARQQPAEFDDGVNFYIRLLCSHMNWRVVGVVVTIGTQYMLFHSYNVGHCSDEPRPVDAIRYGYYFRVVLIQARKFGTRQICGVGHTEMKESRRIAGVVVCG